MPLATLPRKRAATPEPGSDKTVNAGMSQRRRSNRDDHWVELFSSLLKHQASFHTPRQRKSQDQARGARFPHVQVPAPAGWGGVLPGSVNQDEVALGLTVPKRTTWLSSVPLLTATQIRG
ncbi:hypothetical protein CRUP_026879 [Coryphaenoides rupestris]|nr:hypothetical protein CRUP_026879 [Coryphaenoides rupestris]